MMENHTRLKTGKVCGTLSFMLLLVLFLILKFDFYYDLNDDTMIKDILSGAYTGKPSGFCIQMLYPLSFVIALCYKAIPTVPWYGLFLCLCQFFVIFVITWRILSLMKSTYSQVMTLIAEALVICSLFIRELVIIQYSVTSGICMAGAVFLFITAPKTDKAYLFLRKNLLPAFLVILSFMIRTEVCIMLLPFLLLAGISQWCSENKFFTSTNIKKYVILIMTAIVGMLALYSLDMYAYRGSEWTSFRSFFDARTKLYDFYELPAYDENKELYESIGLSRESYTLLENYNFALDESIDTWSFDAIVDYQEKQLNNTLGFTSKNSIKEAIWLYKNKILSMPSAIEFAVIIAYILYSVFAVFSMRGKKRAGTILKILLLVLIRSILWLYLYMVDRVLDRVTIPLLMLELITLASFMIADVNLKMSDEEGIRSEKKIIKVFQKAVTYLVYIMCTACAIIALRQNITEVQSEYDKRAAADVRWNALMDYCRENPKNYYVIDVYSSTSYNGAPYSEKIFKNVDNSYKNFDICGGWAVKSPLTKQKLNKRGLTDIQNALYSKKKTSGTKTYFMAAPDKDLNWILEYYKKRGMNIQLKCVDTVDTDNNETAFKIYELKAEA